ncbi:MAG: hypothetical protein JWP18_1540 [Solirubrobacterales bacterium]|nr:hypothetical protein [Solirubrobacterales bacterium]
MGRRSRTRASSAPAPTPNRAHRRASKGTAAPHPPREKAFDRLPPVRRTLTTYLGCAMAIAVATVLGIAGLGGTLGPFIVLAYVVLGAGLSFRWAQRRLAGETLGNEDRMMQTMAGGMLLISVALAAVSAVLLSVL